MIDMRTGAVLFLWCVVPCYSQAGQAPEVTSRDTTATFNSKVSLVMVPVVVRDDKGRAIGTLKKEDFQLFDKSKPQTISKLSIERADGSAVPLEARAKESGFEKEAEKAPAGPPPASRFVAYLFDDMHTNAADLMAVRQAAIKHLNESMLPGDRAAIYTTSGQIMLEFTDDKERLKETINRIAPKSRLVKPLNPCPDISEYMADQILYKSASFRLGAADSNDQSPLWVAVQEVFACHGKGGLGSAYVLVDGMSQPLFNAIEIARSAAREVYDAADADSQVSFTVLERAVRRMSAIPGQRTIVLTSPGFLLMSHQQMESEVIDQAVRSNVTISTLDARGLYAVTPYGDASTTAKNMLTANFNEGYRAKAAQAQSEVLAELADATGGTFFHNDNDLEEGFRRTGAAPEFRYVLGFSPQILKNDGKFHVLKVTVDMKGVTVNARHGYFAPKQSSDPATDAKEEISAAVFSRDEISEIPVDLHTQFFKASAQRADLTVLARVDLKSLHFKRADGRSRDTLNSVSAVFDRNGILVGAIQKEINLQLKDETFAARIANGIVVKTDFDVPPGTYVVRVVVRDSEGQNMAARSSAVEIP